MSRRSPIAALFMLPFLAMAATQSPIEDVRVLHSAGRPIRIDPEVIRNARESKPWRRSVSQERNRRIARQTGRHPANPRRAGR